MQLDELWTRGSVDLSLALYALALALRGLAGGRRGRLAAARILWTMGWLFFLVHVLCAFHFFHEYSHARAYQATAERTAEVVGWRWGGGLYANYAFMLVWLADVVWWWQGIERYEARYRGIDWALQGFLAFMAFNATVVFGQGVIRWLGLAVCCVLVVLRLEAVRQARARAAMSRR